MINYSIAMLGNPAKQEEPKKAYGVAQYAEKMTLGEFYVTLQGRGADLGTGDTDTPGTNPGGGQGGSGNPGSDGDDLE